MKKRRSGLDNGIIDRLPAIPPKRIIENGKQKARSRAALKKELRSLY